LRQGIPGEKAEHQHEHGDSWRGFHFYREISTGERYFQATWPIARIGNWIAIQLY
jgi:hypothetical protein